MNGRRRAVITLSAGCLALAAVVALPAAAQAAPPAERGSVVMSWRLPIVTGLIQQEVAVYAQSPSLAAVNLQGVDKPGYVWQMPVYKVPSGKFKTAGGVLLINVKTQSVVNLSYLTVHAKSRTISALASFSNSGYQGRMTVFSYDASAKSAVSAARLTLAKGMAGRLNSALKSTIFTEGMTLGTLDVTVRES